MKLSTIIHSGSLALLLGSAGVSAAHAGDYALKFKDPTVPGKVVVQIGLGDVHITGADVTDVTVSSTEDLSEKSETRSDGLRRLDSGDNYSVTSEGNVVTIVCNGMFGGHRHSSDGGPTDLSIKVPGKTSVTIERSGPGDTTLEHLGGDVEIHSAIGDIELDGLSGGAVVETANGDVVANFTNLTTTKPVSITTVRGDVEIHVPVASKADVRFRTFRGEVLTDFSEDQLKTSMERSGADVMGSADEEHAQAELDREQARIEQEQAREEARQAAREDKAVKAEAKRVAKGSAAGSAPPVPPIPPMPPMPHMPSIPTFSGGKVVAGTLNGGGTSLEVTTLMGDITFRKAE